MPRWFLVGAAALGDGLCARKSLYAVHGSAKGCLFGLLGVTFTRESWGLCVSGQIQLGWRFQVAILSFGRIARRFACENRCERCLVSPAGSAQAECCFHAR